MEIEQEIKDQYKDIKIPIFLSEASFDSIVDNDDMEAFYNAVSTPEELKGRQIYQEADHFFIFDGWYSDQAIKHEVEWLDKILK